MENWKDVVEPSTPVMLLPKKRGKVRTSMNYDFTDVVGEVNNLPSETIPDQSLSIKEILMRFSRGLPIDGQKVPWYDEEDDLPDPKTMDLADRQEFAEYARSEAERLGKSKKVSKAPIEPKKPISEAVEDIEPE